METGIYAIAALVPVLVVVVLHYFWPRKGKIGINTNTVHCPTCNPKAPMVRVPLNSREFLWGGWTCKHCGCEFDKYGSEMNT